MGEGIGELEMEELVPEWDLRKDRGKRSWHQLADHFSSSCNDDSVKDVASVVSRISNVLNAAEWQQADSLFTVSKQYNLGINLCGWDGNCRSDVTQTTCQRFSGISADRLDVYEREISTSALIRVAWRIFRTLLLKQLVGGLRLKYNLHLHLRDDIANWRHVRTKNIGPMTELEVR